METELSALFSCSSVGHQHCEMCQKTRQEFAKTKTQGENQLTKQQREHFPVPETQEPLKRQRRLNT